MEYGTNTIVDDKITVCKRPFSVEVTVTHRYPLSFSWGGQNLDTTKLFILQSYVISRNRRYSSSILIKYFYFIQSSSIRKIP